MKRIKKLKELLLPFKFIPTKTIEGNINGDHFFFQIGQETELTFEQYQVILNSSYKDQF